jgi:hypothetical protein
VFRALFLAAIAFAAVVSIDPNWNAKDQQLTLRVRSPAEIFVVARERLLQIGEFLRAQSGDSQSPAVAAPPPRPADESFTPEERRKLGQLVEEHTRGG